MVYGQGVIIFLLVKNLSTCYRTWVYFHQTMRFSVNKSLVDMDVKINTVSAIMYGVALLLIVDQTSGGSNIIASVVLQMILLLWMIVSENQSLHAVAVPLMDLNENRLSKFECALLWIKIMEDFLQDDVMCNFVQIFNSKQLLMPNFEVDPQYSVKLLPVNRNDDEPLSGIFDHLVLSIGTMIFFSFLIFQN
jgi:hypothetical protein